MNALSSEDAADRVARGAGGAGIHGPGAWMRRPEKRNRAGHPSAGRGPRLVAALEAHCERHPNDKRSADRLAGLAKAEAL